MTKEKLLRQQKLKAACGVIATWAGKLFASFILVLIRGAVIYWALQILIGAFPIMAILSVLNYWHVCVLLWAIDLLFNK